MPMLTKIEMTKSAVMFVRIVLDQSSSGRKPLQMIIVHVAHQYEPKARYQKAARSVVLPLYQARKYSQAYAYPTIEPVRRQSLARFSKCLTVMISSSPKLLRMCVSRVITIPQPESITPATN